MTAPLYDRLGGQPAVEAATKGLYDRILADPQLSWAFEGVDMEKQASRMAAFLTLVTGGPAGYTGPPLDQVHARLHLKNQDVDAVIGHLGAVLTELGASEADISEAAAIAESVRGAVIGAG